MSEDKSTASFRPQSLKSRENLPLRDRIADVIEAQVVAGRFQPGDRLPPERRLAEMLGVSRTPVREAIRLLEQRGLVKMRVGSGTYIIGMTPATVAEAIERYCSLTDCSFEDVTAVRDVLEPEIAALAASNATAEELASLQELVDRIEATFSAGDGEGFASSDAEFHLALAMASHNSAMIAIASGLQRTVTNWMRIRFKVHQEKRGAYSHRAIFEAIVARNPVLARAAMITHLATRPRWSSSDEADEAQKGGV